MERTELEELGEFGLIDRIKKAVRIENKSTVKGIGDDCAVLDPGKNQVVVTSDMLTEGVHFDLSYAPLMHLGYKAAVSNFSDVLSMNAYPTQLLISLGVSNRFSFEAVDELYTGVLKACENYNVDLVGGDTVSSTSGLVISGTAIGFQEKEKITLRAGARAGDLICVSGDLGAAYMGLQILEREKKVFKENPKVQPDLSGNDYILERQLKPEARKDIVEKLGKLGVLPTSMIDISDGLSSELLHLSKGSRSGCAVYAEKLPIDPQTAARAEDFHLPPETAALNGGEDFELLFTVKQSDHDKIKSWEGISIIGHVTEESDGVKLVSSTGGLIDLTAQGWDAFLKNKNS